MPDYHKAQSHTHSDNLEWPISVQQVSLDWGGNRKETPQAQGEHANFMCTWPRRGSNLQPWSCEANMLTSKPPCPHLQRKSLKLIQSNGFGDYIYGIIKSIVMGKVTSATYCWQCSSGILVSRVIFMVFHQLCYVVLVRAFLLLIRLSFHVIQMTTSLLFCHLHSNF